MLVAGYCDTTICSFESVVVNAITDSSCSRPSFSHISIQVVDIVILDRYWSRETPQYQLNVSNASLNVLVRHHRLPCYSVSLLSTNLNLHHQLLTCMLSASAQIYSTVLSSSEPSSSATSSATSSSGSCTFTQLYAEPFLNDARTVYQSTTTTMVSVDCHGCHALTSSRDYLGNGGVSPIPTDTSSI